MMVEGVSYVDTETLVLSYFVGLGTALHMNITITISFKNKNY